MKLKLLFFFAAIMSLAACDSYDHGDRGNPPAGSSEGRLSITLRSDGGGSVQAGKYINTTNRDMVISGFKAGDVITLTAVPNPIATAFCTWTAIGNVEFEDAGASTTTFVMPDDNVIIKANYIGTTNNVLDLAGDPNTRTALEANLGEWDTDSDGKLSVAEAAAVKELDLSGKALNNGVWDQLDGVVGYFTGLERLNISNNMYINGFDLSRNPNLKVLIADNISPNYSLSVTATSTPVIDLQYNGKLESVSMVCTTNQGTRLTNIYLPVSNRLKSLHIASTFNPNTYLQRLNLSTLTGLEEFSLVGSCTSLNQIDFPATETLKKIDINPAQWGANNAQLRYVDISKLTGLEEFTMIGFSNLGTVKFPAGSTLKKVDITSSKTINNAMTMIDLTGATGLETFNMAQYGGMIDVKFPATSTLKNIDMKVTLNMNRVMTLLDISMLTGLELLDMTGNYGNYTTTSTAGQIKARRAIQSNVKDIIKMGAGILDNPTVMVYVD